MNPTTLLPLAELLAKSVLLLGGALLLIAGFRRSSAARRHAILLAAFVALLLLPLGKFAAPYWRLSTFAPARPQTMQFTDIVATTDRGTAFEPATPAVQPPRFTWLSPTQWLLGSWCAGAALLLGFRAFGSWRIARLRRHRTVPAGERIADLAQTVARDLGCGPRHEVRSSDAVRVPCTWGLRRAVVLLPVAAEQWSEAHLLAALRHEFAHVARRDYLTRWLSSAVCALYWPNPLVWFATRKLYAAQEQACDDLVLRAGTPSADYATLLFETARACLGAPLGCREAIAMARPSTLQNRVVAVVDETRDRRPAGRFVKLLGALGAAGAVGVSALAQVGGEKLDAPAATAAPPSLAQVEISAKFIELAKGEASPTQVAEGVEAFKKGINPFLGGVDLMAAPRLTMKSGQQGLVQIGEDHDLPPGSEPKKQFVGSSLEVLPTVTGEKIQLQCTVELVAQSGVDPATKQPIFNHRKTTTTLDLANGGTAVLSAIPSDKEGREVFVFLEAKILPPPATKPESPAGAGAGSRGTTLGESLDAQGLRPAPSAKPAEWLRRSFLDIVGRPPTVEEMTSFLRECDAASADRQAAGAGEALDPRKPATVADDLAAWAARAAQRALAQSAGRGPKLDPKAGPPSGTVPEPKPGPGALPPATPAAPESKAGPSPALPGSTPEPKLVPLIPNVDSTAALSLTPKPPVALSSFEGQPPTAPTFPLKPDPAAMPAAGWKFPVDVLADDTKVVNGEIVADGHVRFKYGSTAITADHLNYRADHRAEFHGNVEIKTEGGTMRGDHISVELGQDGRIHFGATTITSESMDYSRISGGADFRGKVEIKTADGTLRGENAEVQIEKPGQVSVGKPAVPDATANAPVAPGR